MRSPAEKGRLFLELHKRREILILPNPWDGGTAKLLASLGFEALATTSLGMSNALGRIDGPAFVYSDHDTGRVTTILGYPTAKLGQTA